MSSNTSNHLVNPAAREAMDKFKMEAAAEVELHSPPLRRQEGELPFEPEISARFTTLGKARLTLRKVVCQARRLLRLAVLLLVL